MAPPPGIQRAFGKIAAGFLDNASNAERKTTTLAFLRDALLPKLLSGELRVPEAERLIETAV